LLTQQIPQLAISGGVGTAAKGVTAARMASAGAAKEAIEKTALKVGVSADIATGALLQGTDVGSDTYDETYKYLVKNGTKLEEAHEIAVSKARQSAAAAAAISIATQNIPGANRMEKALIGAEGGKGIVKGALKTGAGESFTEGLEEGGGAVAKNFAIGQVDPTRQLSQGVGESIGLGAVGGLGLGAPIGAIQGRAEAAQSQLAEDTKAVTGIDPIPSNRDALVKQYQTLLGIPREEAGMLVDQIIAENAKAAEQAVTPETTTEQAVTPETTTEQAVTPETTTEQTVTPGAATTKTPAQVPAGVDPQRLEEIEIEYVNAGFSIEEAKAKALEQAIQETKDFAEEEAASEQEKANAGTPTQSVSTDTGTGLAGAGAGTATDIQQQQQQQQQQLGQPAAGTEVVEPNGVADTGASTAQSAAGEVGESGALGQQEAPPVVTPKASTKEIKASINAATQILKQNKLPYSLDLLAQFTDKDTGLVSKEAVLAYAKQQTPVATGKKTLSQKDIDEKLNDFYLDPEGKKSSVIAFAKKLVAQGILPQEELDSLTRMSKDRDIDKDEVLRELETALDILNKAAPDAEQMTSQQSGVFAGSVQKEKERAALAEAVEESIEEQIASGNISEGNAPIYRALVKGNTKLALELIRDSETTGSAKINPVYKLVAKFLLTANITPKIQFYIPSRTDVAGQYQASTDTVSIAADLHFESLNGFVHTLLHEVVHAGTVNSLTRAFRLYDGLTKGRLEAKSLSKENAEYVRSAEYLAAVNLFEVFNWIAANHGDKFNKTKEDANYNYGALNPLEMVAEIFLNPKFQQVLASITLPSNFVTKEQPTNAYQWFLTSIRKLINIKGVPNNALDQIMRSTTDTVRTREEPVNATGYTERKSTVLEKLGRAQFYKIYGGYETAGMAEAAVKPAQGGAQPAPKKRKKAAPKKTGADKILERIDKSTLADETVGLIGELARAKSFDDVIGILKAGFETLNSKKIQALLPALTTSQIIDWVGDKIPRLVDANRMVERMDTMRMKMLSAMSDIVTPWFDYSKEYTSGSKVLSRTMHYTTLAGVDPTLFPNLAAALTGDTTLVQLNTYLAAATDPKSKTKIKGEITKRTNLLNTTYKLWDQLGSIGKGEGRAIYAKVKDHYKAMFDLHRVLLDRLIVNSTVPGNENDASTPKGKLMAAIRKSYADALKSGVYFPLMRYGNYWVSVGKGVGREFYMFESEFQRDQFVREKVEELQKAGDARKKEKMQEDGDLDYGNDLNKLRVKAAESSEMLRGIFEMVDKNKNTGTQTADTEALKDAIYQMYLTTLPEKDFRKQWIHRKGTAGFSGDALRNFVRAGFSNSGHLSKLRYGHDITLAVDAAHDSLKGNPDKPLLEQFVNEIGTRTGLELNPNVEDGLFSKFANGVNQSAFIMYLTSVKSAIANLTAIPIFGYPVLASRYGMAKTTAKLASYTNIFDHTTLVTSKPNGDLQWPSVSVGMSKHVQSNKVLTAAFADAAERGITEITRTYDLLQMSRMPSDALSNPAVKFKRAAINMMGSMFHASERMNREIMYMASFELAYDKAVSEGKAAGVNGEAYNIAVDAAVKNTYDSMFNYSRFNRPRAFRSPTGRIALQFKMFPQQVTVYLLKNFYSMLPFVKGNDNKKEAATQLIGTLAMTGLFAGVAGLPLYGAVIGLLQAFRNALRDDDEPFPIEERDLDLWFRNVFLPQMFGVRGAEIAYRGLASEAGGDIASSTSLSNMWFRETKDNPSVAAEFKDYIFGMLGPGVAMGENAVKAIDDFRNGYISQGMEKLTPSMFRGMVTAMRWNQEEGIKTKGLQAPIYDEEEVTKAMLVWKILGFTPTDLSKIQSVNFKAKTLVDQAEQTKKDILNRINLDIARGDDAHLEKEFEKFSKFLRDYPTIKFDADTILNSVQKRAELRAMANRGLSIPEELQGEIYPLLGEER